MALSFANLTSGGDTSNIASYATASVSPTANRLLLLAVDTTQGGSVDPTKPTVTGNGLTWVEIGDIIYKNAGTNRGRLTVFRAMGASPSAGVLTIAYNDAIPAPVNQTGCDWTLDQSSSEVDVTGTNGSGAIVQVVESPEPAAGTATTITTTLGSALTAGNRPWAATAFFANEATTGTGGWTELARAGHSTPAASVESCWNAADSDNSATVTWTTAAEAGQFVVEVKATADTTGTATVGTATAAGGAHTATAGALGAATVGTATASGGAHTASDGSVGATGTATVGTATAAGGSHTATAGATGIATVGTATADGGEHTATDGAVVSLVIPRRGASGRWALIITDPHSDANPRVVPLNGGSFTWVVSDSGSANVEVATRDLLHIGLMPPSLLGGMYLRWEHAYLGPWRGELTAPAGRPIATELVGKTWDVLLSGRRAPKAQDTGMGRAGDVLRRAVADRYRASDPIGVDIVVRGGRAMVSSIQRATDLRSMLGDLVRQTDEEFWVDHSGRAIDWTARAGRDKSASVVLCEGGAVVDFAYRYDLEAIFNELLASPALAPFDRTRTITLRDDASISRHGLRQTSAVVPGLITRAGLRSIGKAILSRLANQGDTLALTVANVNGVWGDFREGDSLEVRLPSINLRCRARVMVRHYELESDRLTLSCNVEAEL